MANRTGISLTVLGAVERGNRTVEADMLNIIAQTLEIEVRELTD
ncbi:transcriptional regulator [Paenibacillus polymyxa SC2]|uniref:Transcriptional regulator n=1 Tax=Paenibacillus polymyxa (strain SC2) TaxID=886882 RepID=A0A0D5ZC76_PAEPS|nr:transcriptional regulator [Paenibacillus polymyxa]AKA44171.1 transcriptional regulator [Paenibacillus polymyxa SC2]